MGGSSSKTDSATDNKGLLNGNFINNGNIVEQIDKDIVHENLLLTIIIVLKFIHIAIIVVKYFVKYIRRSQQRDQELHSVLVAQNIRPGQWIFAHQRFQIHSFEFQKYSPQKRNTKQFAEQAFNSYSTTSCMKLYSGNQKYSHRFD